MNCQLFLFPRDWVLVMFILHAIKVLSDAVCTWFTSPLSGVSILFKNCLELAYTQGSTINYSKRKSRKASKPVDEKSRREILKASDTLGHLPTPWPVPYACAQQHHPGSGSHGHLFRPNSASSAWHSRRAIDWCIIHVISSLEQWVTCPPSRGFYQWTSVRRVWVTKNTGFLVFVW